MPSASAVAPTRPSDPTVAGSWELSDKSACIPNNATTPASPTVSHSFNSCRLGQARKPPAKAIAPMVPISVPEKSNF
jgi:hypothetical protein